VALQEEAGGIPSVSGLEDSLAKDVSTGQQSKASCLLLGSSPNHEDGAVTTWVRGPLQVRHCVRAHIPDVGVRVDDASAIWERQ
jgi:hypothetical protein